jgi:hypothetical protein
VFVTGLTPSGRAKKGVRQKTIFPSGFKLIWAVQPWDQKNSSFQKSENVINLAPSRAHQEGRTRRHERGARDATDVSVRQTSATDADGEVVWS